MKELWPWITLALLGAYHGINPGMGWLFAVALGLQERSRAAVVRSFAPIALGHAVSIGFVVALVALLQAVVSPTALRWGGAAVLTAFGVYKLLAPMSHPRWVGMRVGFRELTVWSFLMATAHGAGLMVVPVVMELPSAVPAAHAASAPVAGTVVLAAEKPAPAAGAPAEDCHAEHGAQMKQAAAGSGMGGPLPALAAVLLHTLAMFVVMAGVAVVVYEKVGLAILRKAWFNLDLLWAAALIGAGVVTLLL